MRKSITVAVLMFIAAIIVFSTSGLHADDPSGIYGAITTDGQQWKIWDLHLIRFDSDGKWIRFNHVGTDDDGNYLFTDLESLAPGEKYRVLYSNDRNNPNYLAQWWGPAVTDYSSGDYVNGGDFDIANVELLEPAPGTAVTYPMTFKWTARGIEGDSYRVSILDANSQHDWESADLGNVDSLTLTEQPPGMGGVAYWTVFVYNGPNGWGQAYELQQSIIFPETSYVPLIIGS